MKATKAYGTRPCVLCESIIEDGDDYSHIPINNKQHSICSVCSNKMYYYYRDIIFDKIKHP